MNNEFREAPPQRQEFELDEVPSDGWVGSVEASQVMDRIYNGRTDSKSKFSIIYRRNIDVLELN